MRCMRCDFRRGFEKTPEEMAKLKGNHWGKFHELGLGSSGTGTAEPLHCKRKSKKRKRCNGRFVKSD